MNRDQRVKVPILKAKPVWNILIAFLLALLNVVLYSVYVVVPFFTDTSQSVLYFLTKNHRNFTFIVYFYECLLVLIVFPFLIVKVIL